MPVIRTRQQIRHRMVAKKIAVNPSRRCFARHCLGAVFAEFEHMAFPVGIGPGTALAIEAVLLVDLGKDRGGAPQPGAFQAVLETLHDRRQSSRRAGNELHPGAFGFGRGDRAIVGGIHETGGASLGRLSFRVQRKTTGLPPADKANSSPLQGE